MMKASGSHRRVISSLGVLQLDERVRQVPRQVLEYLVASNPSAILLIDEDNILTYLNQAGAHLFGYTPVEILGKPVRLFMAPHERAGQPYAAPRFCDPDEPTQDWNPRLQGVHKNGAMLDLEVSFSRFEHGDSIQFMGVIADVTERDQARKQLADERARFDAFFERSHEALFIHDPFGRIINANTRAQELVGLDLETLQGMRVAELHPKNNQDPNYFNNGLSSL